MINHSAGGQMVRTDIDLSVIASQLELGPDNIWVSHRQAGVSYPPEGNENCLGLEEDSFWFEHRSSCIQALMQLYPPPGVVFDVGGGNGYVAGGLKRAGIPVVLVEPGRQGIQNARRRGLDTLVCSTLEDAGFYDETLPAVGLFDVLEHIKDDKAFLQTIYPLLIPGGRIYLTVPALGLLWSVDDVYAGHHRRYSSAEMQHTLASAGFKVEFASYLFSMLPQPIPDLCCK